MAWSQNAMNDWIYDKLNVAGITGTVSTRIYHHEVPPGTEATYPLARYQVWNRFRPQHTLGNGRSSYRGSYRIVGIFVDDPRAANTFATAIENAMLTLPHSSLVGGAQIVNCRPTDFVYSVKSDYGDGKSYIQAGATFEIEVTA